MNGNVYCVTIDFDEKRGSPSRVFRAMSEIIDTCQELDNTLLVPFGGAATSTLVLERIEAGSLKSWLRSQIETIDDTSLKNLNWKQILGKYLVRGKYQLLEHIKDKKEIRSIDQLTKIQGGLTELARSTEIKFVPHYMPVPQQDIAYGIQRITNSLSYLEDYDRASYSVHDDIVPFNQHLSISSENIEQLITKEIINSRSDMILKVKKPDYLGSSQWELRYDNRIVLAKVLDDDWLKAFQNRTVIVQPGDSIRAHVETRVHYDIHDSVIGTHYDILEVMEILSARHREEPGLFDS